MRPILVLDGVCFHDIQNTGRKMIQKKMVKEKTEGVKMKKLKRRNTYKELFVCENRRYLHMLLICICMIPSLDIKENILVTILQLYQLSISPKLNNWIENKWFYMERPI